MRARLPEPERGWGLMAQLYSVRSRRSAGMGDLRDLADLARWSAEAHGASFVLVNPLHAGEPAPPIRPSPYLPSSRRYVSPLYLAVEGAPRIRNDGHLIDRDAVWAAKMPVLERRYAEEPRSEAFDAYLESEGEDLTTFATWCTLAEDHGPDWRRWPEPLHDRRSPAVADEARRRRDRVGFHAWLQWLLDVQLGDAQKTARDAGMSIGVIHDVAVGVDPGGADAWAYRDLFAAGMSVGAPPDEFNQRGQDWNQPPWDPDALAAVGYAPYRQMMRAAMRHGGGIRLDHAMQVFRLWWVPSGASPAEGSYVGYNADALLDVLVEEALAAGAVIVGEDLGTVEPYMRGAFAERGVLGTSMAWFERDAAGGGSLPAESWRRGCLATVGTHDMPPIAGFVRGDHIDLRERLGLLTRPAALERAELAGDLREWHALLGVADDAPADDMVIALHAFLARTPALLRGASLADVVGDRRTQNQPGTTDQYPNWRVPLSGPDGDPYLLDDLAGDPRAQAAIAAIATEPSIS